jgi:hypothetical protein
MEIAWEFFRDQTLWQFPVGLNPRYGLELSSTMVFDGQIPLLSLLFHPFNFLLPERFQYVGIFLFMCFVLNFFVAKKTFLLLKLNEVNSSISSVIVSTSPVILYRYVDSDHYGLTAGFILFFAMYLVLKNDSSFHKWALLYLISILIFIYYTAFIAIIHVTFLVYRVFFKKETIKVATTKLLLTFFISIFIMFCLGFFYGEVDSTDVGFGLFRSTLTSLVDSTQWSTLLPDIKEFDGAYEGFAYVGLPSIVLISSLIFIRRKIYPDLDINRSFFVLWFSSSILFIFSLSNKIAFATQELFEYSIPNQFVVLVSTFRSSGRFAWLLVFVLFFWLVYKTSLKISSRILTALLSILLFLHLVDIENQLSSQKNQKFANTYKTNLINIGWAELRNCYENIRIYPPTTNVENSYNFVNLANDLGLGVNTGRFGRLNNDAINGAFELMHEEFSTGVYRSGSFYVFSNSEFVNSGVIDYHKNMAIRTLNNDSAYGVLDGFTFLAPNLNDCKESISLKAQVLRFGVPDEQKFTGQLIEFSNKRGAQNFSLTGFSTLEDWGTWSLGESSKVTLNTSNLSDFTKIRIYGKDFAYPLNQIQVYLNKVKVGNCEFKIDFSMCTLNYDFASLSSEVINLEFKPKIIRSPKMMNVSENSANIGFGLVNLSLG